MKSAITISIDRELLRACRSAAFAARRTLSSQIEQWIDEKLALDAAPASTPASTAAVRGSVMPAPTPRALAGLEEETAADLCATAPPVAPRPLTAALEEIVKCSTAAINGPPVPRRRTRRPQEQEVCS